jgi:hypothetical protein
MPGPLSLLLVLPQLPQDSASGAARSLDTICEMLVLGTGLILLVEMPDKEVEVEAEEALSETATALIDELLENDWPIPFRTPPQAEDWHWQRLGQTRGVADPEVVSRRQECQRIQRRHSEWEVGMHRFLHMCRSYLNDFGKPEDKRRFEGSGLVMIAQSDSSSMSVVTYLKDQCLADLQSIARLVSRVRKPELRESVGALSAGANKRQAVESAQMPLAQEPQGLRESPKAKKPVRRSQKYKTIDDALQEIAESRPSTQEGVFQSLDGRHVVIPPAEPFVTARGWIAGFRRDKAAARAWLSKRWAELSLSPLPRGPKNPKK